MDYIFKTTTTMKAYNNKKWWIDNNTIKDIQITADNLKAAIEKYRKTVVDRDYIEISRNAIKNKSPMFIDDENGNAQQIGYVITGKTAFDKGDYTGYSTQYIDLWITILTVANTNFTGEARQ